MFGSLGRLIARRPGRWLLGWAAFVVLLVLVRPDAARVARSEPRSLLPADAPYNVALRFQRKAFPQVSSRTRTALIFAAHGGLTTEHHRFCREIGQRLATEFAPAHGWSIQSPYTQPFLENRLRSADGAAVMLVVNSDTNYLTRRSVTEVQLLDATIRPGLPPGLRFEITGEGGLGRDLAQAADQAFRRTTGVTLLALLAILGLIYRAPLAALVPLAAIGLSVVGALLILDQFTRLAWAIGTFERTLAVVLLFGSGTDFALFWLATYREQTRVSPDRTSGMEVTTRRTGPAIATSAATTICGLLMLTSADLIPSSNAGRALAVALVVSLVAALTLVPALAVLLGRALYWPRRDDDARRSGDQGLWACVGRWVTGRPELAILGCAMVFAWPAVNGWRARYTYDALGVVPPDGSAARGRQLAREHFTAEQLFSWTCVIAGKEVGADLPTSVAQSAEVAHACRSIAGVADVWSIAHPLGATDGARAPSIAANAARLLAAPYYLSSEPAALRFEIVLDQAPLSDGAMRSCTTALQTIHDWARTNIGDGARVLATGLTPYILNIKSVADRDQLRVIILVLVVIFIVVLVLVRDVPLTVVMLAATVVVYLVTLGATEWFFTVVAGRSGIDWKVKLFTFVILVAVGQDYNIFLVSRILHERREHDVRTAAARAIAGTGGVISSCGAIMAATLGSLAATGLPLFQELGFAFAVGVLVDTFVVRPIVVPAAYVLLQGRGDRSMRSSGDTVTE